MRSPPTLVALYLSAFSVLQASHALDISVQPGTGVNEITVGKLVNVGLSWAGGDPSPLDIRIVDSKGNWDLYIKAKNDLTLASDYFPNVNLNNQPFRVEAITQDGTTCWAHSSDFTVKPSSSGYATTPTSTSPAPVKPPPATTPATTQKGDITPASSSSSTSATNGATGVNTSSTGGPLETDTTGPSINNFGTITYGSSASSSLHTDSLSGTTTPPTAYSKHVPLGPIIGGVIGGICLLALIAFIVILLLRRRRGDRDQSPTKADLANRPFLSSSNPSSVGAPSPTMFTSGRLVEGSSPQSRDDLSLEPDTREVRSEQEVLRRQLLEINRRMIEIETREQGGQNIRDSAPPDYRTIV